MRAAEIREARKKAGYTQQQFADIMRVSRMTIFNWEHDVHKPSQRDLDYMKEHFTGL
jgi:DNA-binding transcriptional regulator YiaG